MLRTFKTLCGAGTKDDLGNMMVKGPAVVGASRAVLQNPVAGFKVFADGLLGFLQEVTEIRLSPAQRAVAKDIGLQVAGSEDATLSDLVRAWGQSPDLAGFSTAVARVVRPGKEE
jgi:hypothetical protein